MSAHLAIDVLSAITAGSITYSTRSHILLRRYRTTSKRTQQQAEIVVKKVRTEREGMKLANKMEQEGLYAYRQAWQALYDEVQAKNPRLTRLQIEKEMRRWQETAAQEINSVQQQVRDAHVAHEVAKTAQVRKTDQSQEALRGDSR